VGHHAHRRQRQQHEADGEQRDRAHVGAQLGRRGQEGRGVQQRRQEEQEDEGRIELRRREAGDDADEQAADQPDDRVGDVRRPRHAGQRGDEGEQAQEELDVVHVGRHTPSAPLGAAPGSPDIAVSRLR
jgi:hypothetical protein